MYTLGRNNWIYYGWGPDLLDNWDDALPLHMEYHVNKEKIRPVNAAVIAVNRIVSEYPSPYVLMCSGGIDSQTMIWAWVLSGQEFTVASVRYKIDDQVYNDHDLVQLEMFCKQHSISIEYLDFDITNFLETRLKEVSDEYDCDSPQICTHMAMSEMIEQGTIMFSGNFLSRSGVGLNYTLLGQDRYAKKVSTEHRKIIPSFLAHDSDFSSSFLKYHDSLHTIYPDKVAVLHNTGFPVIPQLAKYTGFEKIKDYYDLKNLAISAKDRIKYSMYPSKRAFDLYFRYPLHVGYGKGYRSLVSLIIE